MNQPHFIVYKNSHIAYYVYGKGSNPVYCLHGFSLSGLAYESLGAYCPEGKIMFAIDFPLHGKTDWKEADLFPEDLWKIFELIYQKEIGQNLSTIELMAHSMGGRISLYLYQCFPDKISKLILAAPDGLVRQSGHRLLFKTSFGPKLFRKMSHSSKLIMSIANLARRLRIINKSVFTLIKSSYEEESTAKLVYDRLMVTQRFYPDIAAIKKKIKLHKTNVYLFFGKYDAIVPSKYAKYLQKGEEDLVHITILLSGHLILANQEVLPQIAAVI